LSNTTTYSEEDLVALLKSGDESAFSYLYDHYSGALNGIIFRMINDTGLAEDILQEAFVKIWNNFSSYDPSKGRLFTWMLNITRNLAIDTIRSKGYKKQSKIQSSENAVDNVSNNINSTKNQQNKGDKMHLLYDYLTSNEFSEQWKAIREGFVSMKMSIIKERDAMEKLWKAREKQLEKVLLNAAHVKGSIEGISGMDAIDLSLMDEQNLLE
jgi:RNA polymerase sigma factor (sigma-70 family)